VNSALKLDPAEQYTRLRLSIIDDKKTGESQTLVAEAKKLLSEETPENQARAREVLGELLQVAPDHAWARAEYVRLSKLEDEPHNSGEIVEESGWDAGKFLRAAVTVVVRVVRGTASLAQTHLSALLLLITALAIFRSPLTKTIAKAFKRRSLLSGCFPRFTLSEILIMLNTESHSGVLQVKGSSCRGQIYIDKGEPCHCSVGKVDGVPALYILLGNTEKGFFEFDEGSLPMNQTIDTPLSVILMEYSDGGPGSSRSRRKKPKKQKSRMKELLESKSAE
jgi:hypothetical protein